MISDEELAQLRGIQEEAMRDTGMISRKSVANNAGVRTPTFANVGTSKCRARPVRYSPQVRELAEKVGRVIDQEILFPVGTDVKEGDQVQINGRTFDVVGIPLSSFETARLCYCVEVKR